MKLCTKEFLKSKFIHKYVPTSLIKKKLMIYSLHCKIIYLIPERALAGGGGG